MRCLAVILLSLLMAFSGTACTKQAPDAGEETVAAATSVPPALVAPDEEDNSLDDYDDYSEEDVAVTNDPLEGWNRFWFHTNDWFIQNILKPAHRGYAFVVPEPIRSRIEIFAYNLAFPVRMLNFILQGEFAQAGVEFDRSLVNFMVSLGFADVASQSKPLYDYYPETANFDYTLGSWGVPDGPYFMIPFLGPSTIRGAVGRGSDYAMKPQDYFIGWPITLSSSAFFVFNSSDTLYKPYDQVTQSALEPYVALRNAYMNRRLQLQSRLEAEDNE